MSRRWGMRAWWRWLVPAGLLLTALGAAWQRRRPFDPSRPAIGWGMVSLRIDEDAPPERP